MIGYYTLSTVAIEHADLPDRVHRNAPNPVPAVLVGRLAIDTKAQGTGLGRLLMRDAILSTLAAADRIGVRTLLVHALHEQAAGSTRSLASSAPPPIRCTSTSSLRTPPAIPRQLVTIQRHRTLVLSELSQWPRQPHTKKLDALVLQKLTVVPDGDPRSSLKTMFCSSSSEVVATRARDNCSASLSLSRSTRDQFCRISPSNACYAAHLGHEDRI